MRSDPRPRASAKANRDEGEVRIADLVPEFGLRDLGASLADLRAAPGPHAAGHAGSDEQLPVRLNRIEVHGIRVDDDRPSPMDAHSMEPVHGVPAGPAAADDQDLRACEGEGLEERLVPGALCGLDAHP